MLTCHERHWHHEPPSRSDALQGLPGRLPATRQDPGRGLGVVSQKGPREQSAHELLASSPLDSHTLGTHSSKDPWPGGDRGLKLHVLGEAFFPTLARTGDVSDLRTLDHGMGTHGPSHPWLGLQATPYSALCPQEAETVPAPV